VEQTKVNLRPLEIYNLFFRVYSLELLYLNNVLKENLNMDNYKGMMNNEKKFVFDLETGLMLDKSLEKKAKTRTCKGEVEQ
jgi:hypothetical protein